MYFFVKARLLHADTAFLFPLSSVELKARPGNNFRWPSSLSLHYLHAFAALRLMMMDSLPRTPQTRILDHGNCKCRRREGYVGEQEWDRRYMPRMREVRKKLPKWFKEQWETKRPRISFRDKAQINSWTGLLYAQDCPHVWIRYAFRAQLHDRAFFLCRWDVIAQAGSPYNHALIRKTSYLS